jgi:hypothetical protein
MKKRKIAVSIFFLICLIRVNCEVTQPLPVDKDANWIVGFTSLEGVHLSTENLYLADSIPLIFKEKIQSVRTHNFKPGEITEYRRFVVRSELAAAIKELLALQKQRDQELFKLERAYEREKAITGFEKQIEEKKERITYLRNLDPSQIVFPDSKPILYKDNEGKLFDPPQFSALRYAEEKGVHVLIWGRLEEVQGFLYLEINVFDRVLEKNIFTYKEGGSREDLYNYFADAEKELTTVLLGREWAALLVDTVPQNAYIKVNEDFKGLGTVDLKFLEPGKVKIDVSSPGYMSQIKEVELKPFESASYQFTLEESGHEDLFIQSYPPLANVYVDSLWIGKTPLIIEKPFVISKLLIKKADFGDYFTRIGPQSPGTIEIGLTRSYIDRTEYQEKMALNFYNSLGAFMISLPVTLFSYGLSYDYNNAGFSERGRFFFYTYRWSFFVNCVLLATTIYDLIIYIRAGDRPQG